VDYISNINSDWGCDLKHSFWVLTLSAVTVIHSIFLYFLENDKYHPECILCTVFVLMENVIIQIGLFFAANVYSVIFRPSLQNCKHIIIIIIIIFIYLFFFCKMLNTVLYIKQIIQN